MKHVMIAAGLLLAAASAPTSDAAKDAHTYTLVIPDARGRQMAVASFPDLSECRFKRVPPRNDIADLMLSKNMTIEIYENISALCQIEHIFVTKIPESNEISISFRTYPDLFSKDEKTQNGQKRADVLNGAMARAIEAAAVGAVWALITGFVFGLVFLYKKFRKR